MRPKKYDSIKLRCGCKWSYGVANNTKFSGRYKKQPVPLWVTQLKGEYCGQYELSVVRDDNGLGKRSWGRGGMKKIILFGSDMAENNLDVSEDGVVTSKAIEFALKLANGICHMLNKEQVRNAEELSLQLSCGQF